MQETCVLYTVNYFLNFKNIPNGYIIHVSSYWSEYLYAHASARRQIINIL